MGDKIVDLYSQRWGIQMGHREMKQHLLANEFTLRIGLSGKRINTSARYLAEVLKGIFSRKLTGKPRLAL